MRMKLYLYGIAGVLLLCLGTEGILSEAFARRRAYRVSRPNFAPSAAPSATPSQRDSVSVQQTVAKPEIEEKETVLTAEELDSPLELSEPKEETQPQDVHAMLKEKYKEKRIRPEILDCLVELAAEAQKEKPGNPASILQKIPREMRLNRDEILALNQEQAPFVSPQEYAAIEGLNRYRTRCGLWPCLLDWRLCQKARQHSGNMARYRFFSHVTPWGETHSARGARAENIYMGSRSGHAANSAWINSPGHRANMVGGYFHVGVGAFGGYFTQMFR